MTVKYLIDQLRDRLTNNPDESVYMADIYAGICKLNIPSLPIMIYYTHDHNDNMEFIQILQNPTIVTPRETDTLCAIKSSEVESGKWIYRVGNEIDILVIDEEMEDSRLLDQVELHYGQAAKTAVLHIPDYIAQ